MCMLSMFSLDMESIDALAKAVNEYNGGLVLVSHDMRLISQVAKEIWICDHKTVKRYGGDIQNFKMDMRSQMGIEGEQKSQLRGDASVRKSTDTNDNKNSESKKVEVKVEKKKVVSVDKPVKKAETSLPTINAGNAWDSDEEVEMNNNSKPHASLNNLSSLSSSLPSGAAANVSESSPATTGKYVPPHLRNRK